MALCTLFHLARVGALFISFAAAIAAVPNAPAQGVLIPQSTRNDIVFDHAGKYLYITTTDGWVRRYNLSSRELEPGYYLGGQLNGLDIAPDDSFLLVANGNPINADGRFQKVALDTGAVADITYPRELGGGGWDVAIAANGIALATTISGSSLTPLLQIDLATNAITARKDAPGSLYGTVVPQSRVARNANGTRLIVSEIGSYAGVACFTYSALNDTFSAPGRAGTSRAALNRDGTLIATGFRFSAALDTVDGYNLKHVFSHLGAGVAFDPTKDTFYVASIFSFEIIAYDTNTFAEKFRLPIGEPVDDPYFDRGFGGDLVASPDGKYLAFATKSGVWLFKISPEPSSAKAPVFEIPTDMVFDHSGKYLYISTYRGFIWPYNLSTGKLESPYNAGGILWGLDISPDDSFLLVAQNYRGINQGTFQKVDLKNGAITNINYELQRSGEDGSWDVAIASNGQALTTTSYGGSSQIPLRQINLATNTITIRNDAPESGSLAGLGTQIHRSADRNRFVFLDSRGSNGPIFSYDATSDTFGPVVYQNKYWGQTSAAVNRDGSLMAWAFGVGVGGHLQSMPSFLNIHTFTAIDIGAAFDAVRDVLYGVGGVNGQRWLLGYDTNTFEEVVRLNIGESVPDSFDQFGLGNLVASQEGRYLALITPSTLRVFDVPGKTVVALPTPTPPPASPGRLANISTRAVTQIGDNIPIAGFIITGTSQKKVVLRAMGPSLAGAGVSGVLEDPTLELYDQTGALIANNDNWKDSPNVLQIVRAGLSSWNDSEAAIGATLSLGAYTAVLRGKNQTTGVALVEVYDIDPTADSRLANISTRAFVGAGDNVVIGGLIVSASTARVLVRGVGPSLIQSHVMDALQDPTLELHDGNGAAIAVNDNWQDSQPAEVWNTGLQPTDDRESAILATLAPGNYTAILRGKNNTTGTGLVEVYNLQ